MKKEKNFKRVISGILSVAMLANFSTVFPVTAFADDDIQNETTINNLRKNYRFDFLL